MAGKRVSYLHPVKMYIFISIVYFLLLFQSSHKAVSEKAATGNPANTEKKMDSIKRTIEHNPHLSADQKKKIENELSKDKIVTSYGIVKVTEDKDDNRGPNTWFAPTTKDTTYDQYLENQAKLPEGERDDFFTKLWDKKKIKYRQEYGNRAKEVFIDEIKHNAPKMMFLLLPLFALILKVAFWKNKKYYVEHLIYSFHFHCFLFLSLTLLILLQLVIPSAWKIMDWFTLLATLYIIWYIYRSLLVVYHRSRFRTISKILGVGAMYFAAFSFCLILLIGVTAII